MLAIIGCKVPDSEIAAALREARDEQDIPADRHGTQSASRQAETMEFEQPKHRVDDGWVTLFGGL